MFGSIPIPVATHLKSESKPRQRSFEMVSIIGQNYCLGDRHVLLQFPQEQYDRSRRSGRRDPSVQKFVRLRIDGSVQPATFVIRLDHRLVNRDVIRRRITGRL